MTFDPHCITQLPVERFRRFGIACCYRLGCDRMDKRLAKALKRLEDSLGPPPNEKLRQDAYNTANSAYLALHDDGRVIRATACTLVCACADGPNINLIGNFESALEEGECLGRDEIRRIEGEIFQTVQDR
jgi:hypothetical protein